MKTPVLIVGGGLAGLTAAYHFHQAGIRFILLEARDRLGGRILSTNAKGIPSADGFDLGPSWFWPGMQTALNYVVDVLELPYFAQHGDGDMLFQRHSGGVPQRFAGVRQVPESMRLTGGVGSIITALSSKLPEDNIRLGVRVTKAILTDSEVEVCVEDSNGATSSLTAMHVVFALPPRLLEATIAFSPALDIDTTRNWRDTPTWMAPHAKLFALYERPFWRQAGLSGTAQSLVGPLGEIHDATTASGKAALFGFIGMSSRQRSEIGRDAIIEASIRQLVQLFGPEAGAPHATLYKDWALDPLTATPGDRISGEHPVPGGLAPVPTAWRNRVWLAGSEAGGRNAGYLAGAIEAADSAVLEIMKILERA